MVAGREVSHIRSDGRDDARQVGAEGERQGLRQRALAGADPGIPRADAGSFDLNQNLAFTWLGEFDVFEGDDLRRAVVVDARRLGESRLGGDGWLAVG